VLGDRRKPFRTLAWLAAAAMTMAALFAPGAALPAAATLMVAGVLVSCWHGIAYAEIAETAGVSRSGTALGLENTSVFVGALLGPLTVSLVLAVSGWTSVWAVMAVCAVIAAAIIPGPRPSTAVLHESATPQQLPQRETSP
jgi:MFS family permease